MKNGGSITIGNGVHIAPHVIIFAANHIFADTDIPIYKQGTEKAPIVIEDDVWVASNVVITAGVRIGRGSVIGAGAVVTKDIPPWSVAVGVPARVIRTRKEQESDNA
jgi:acetyltransferase-like isoleucine patch superfamily enzyme